MDKAQEFLADRLGKLGVMLTPIPSPAKMVINLEGSTPRDNEYNPGPLIKVDGNGLGIRGEGGKYNSIQLPSTSAGGLVRHLLQ